MSICTVEIDVAADRERTFAYLADAANQPQWRHDVATCELTGGAAGTVGAVYRQTNRGQAVEFASPPWRPIRRSPGCAPRTHRGP